MKNINTSHIATFLADTAREAGAEIMTKYHNVKQQRSKGDRGDIVTEADIASEKLILERIKSSFPNDGIVSEEAGKYDEGGSERFWLVDPLDGTRNFALGIPFFCVSIALIEGTKAIASVVYDPVHDEMFLAERGSGAILNGNKLKVMNNDEIDDAVISVSWLRRRVRRSQFIGYMNRVAKHTSYFRRLGSAALVCCYVAAGRVDAYMQGAINCWDVAAASLIVEEAGGLVTDFESRPLDLSKPHTDILAANPALHARILREIIGKE